MAKIFVSYSRKDIEFARKLTDELQKNDLDFWVDWEGIPPTVDWWQQIEKGIEEADVFLFLISPDSASSKICGQEIDCAVKNGKRLIPLVVRDIKGEEAPAQLGHINWIFFRKTDDFEASSAKLLTAIQTDYEWAQTHRRLQVKALEWERTSYEKSFLLRGKDLQDAELQLATNTSKEPHPTDLQREHVLRSRQAADRQRRITTGISIAGIISLAALAVFGFVQAGLATQNAVEAQNQAATAIAAKAEAESSEKKAVAAQAVAEAESRIANSGRLALESKSTLNEYPQRALLLALEAVRINEDANEPVRSDAEEALRLATERVSGIGLPGFKHQVTLVQFTDDNQWLVAGTLLYEGEIKIWNFEKLLSDPAYQPFYASFSPSVPKDFFQSGYLSPQTTWLVVGDSKETKLWQIDAPNEKREPLTFQGNVEFANSEDDREVLEKQADKVVLWRIDLKDLSKKELATFDGSFAAISKDHKYLVTDDPQKGLLLWNFSLPSAPLTLLTAGQAPDYSSILIDPNDQWLIIFEKVPHEEIQVDYYDEITYEYKGKKPWESTTFILIPLGQRNPQQYKIELDTAIDPYYTKFSPDGNTFVYQGFPPYTSVDSTPSKGMLKFIDLKYVNLTFPRNNDSIVNFINKDWFYMSMYDQNSGAEAGKLFDLRQNDLFAAIDLPLTLLLDGNNDVKFSDDGAYILTTSGDLLDFHQLDFNHSIVIQPAPQVSATSALKSLPLILVNSPRQVGFEGDVTVTAESPDKHWLIAGTVDGSLRLWNNLDPWESSNIHMPVPTSFMALSNDDQWMATSNTLWRLNNGKPIIHYSLGEADTDFQIGVFSPDSRWLAMIQSRPEGIPDDFSRPQMDVKLIDLKKLKSDGELDSVVISEKTDSYQTITFSPDSHWLVYTNGSKASLLYDLGNSKNYELSSQLVDFGFTQDQKHIVLFDQEGSSNEESTTWRAGIWSLPTSGKSRLEKIGQIDDPISGFPIVSRNGRWLFSSRKLWDLNCIIEKYECRPFVLAGSQGGFSINSRYLIVGNEGTGDSFNTTLYYDVWDLQNSDQNNEPEKIYSSQTSNSHAMISRDGNVITFDRGRLNFAHAAGLFSAWGGENSTTASYTTFDGYGYLNYGFGGGGGEDVGSFQKDYSVEALTLQDNSISSPILLRGHESNITATQISPNEKYVLTFSGALTDDGGPPEKLLRLWDMDKMRLDPTTKPVILPLNLGVDGDIQVLAFSPDSRWIYVVDHTNTLHYFPILVEDLKKQACTAVGRNFIINEWERFFPNTDYRKTCDNLPEHPSAISQ